MTHEDILNEASIWNRDMTIMCKNISEDFEKEYNGTLQDISKTIEETKADVHDSNVLSSLIEGLIKYYLLTHNSPEPDLYFYATVAVIDFISSIYFLTGGTI